LDDFDKLQLPLRRGIDLSRETRLFISQSIAGKLNVIAGELEEALKSYSQDLKSSGRYGIDTNLSLRHLDTVEMDLSDIIRHLKASFSAYYHMTRALEL